MIDWVFRIARRLRRLYLDLHDEVHSVYVGVRPEWKYRNDENFPGWR